MHGSGNHGHKHERHRFSHFILPLPVIILGNVGWLLGTHFGPITGLFLSIAGVLAGLYLSWCIVRALDD